MRGHPGWCLGQKNRLGVPSPSGDSCLDDDPLQGRIHAQAISPDWVGGQPKHLGAVFAVLLAYPSKAPRVTSLRRASCGPASRLHGRWPAADQHRRREPLARSSKLQLITANDSFSRSMSDKDLERLQMALLTGGSGLLIGYVLGRRQ